MFKLLFKKRKFLEKSYETILYMSLEMRANSVRKQFRVMEGVILGIFGRSFLRYKNLFQDLYMLYIAFFDNSSVTIILPTLVYSIIQVRGDHGLV